MIKRKALSSVISTLILSATVIAIGGGIWSFSIGASTVIADNYVNDTLELVNEVTERFIVEHVTIDAGLDTLSIWVYNYGDHRVTVDVYVRDGDTVIGTTLGERVDRGFSSKIIIEIAQRSPDDQVTIKIHSRRQNNAYETYFVP